MKISIIALLFFCFGNYADAATLRTPPNNLGLVGYWSFDEGTSTTAGDYSGKGNKGTLTGGPTWVSGKHGKALDFDGTDDDVRPPNNAFNSLSDGTISFWMKPDVVSSTASMFTGSNLAGTNDYVTITFLSSKVSGLSRIGGVNQYIFSADTTLPVVGKWQHVVWTKTGTTHAVYINGVNQTLTFSTDVDRNIFFSNVAASAGTVGYTIGQFRRNTNANYYNGQMDDIRIYSRALSAAEVLALYKSGEAKVNVPTQNPNLMSGLVGWWTLDGKDITDKVYDISGQGNNGYIYNTATSSAKVVGKLGQALKFDGVNGYIQIPYSASYNPTTAVTYAFWIKKATVQNNIAPRVFSKADDSIRIFYASQTTQNLQGFIKRTGATQNTSQAIGTTPNNTWTHVALTYDSSNLKTYINGSLTNTYATSTDMLATNSVFRIAGDSTRELAGSIDDFRIYSRALSAAEVLALYRSGAAKVNAPETSRLTDGLVGYWTFDGPDITTTVTDRSGNGNSGYIYNTATSSAKTIGKVGQALKFDGVDDLITTSNDSIGTGAFSFSAWIKANSMGGGNFGRLFDNHSSSIASLAGLQSNLVKFSSNGTTNNVSSATNSIQIKTWYHIVVVRNADNTGNIYINGSLSGTGNQNSGTPVSGNTNIIIGNRSNGQRAFDGIIDEVRIYNRALSAGEVKQLYLLGK